MRTTKQAVAGAKDQGAASIIGVDKNSMKREKGEAFGMTHFVNPDHFPTKPISELVKDLTGGHGVDYCVECTGAAPLISQALDSTKVVRKTRSSININHAILKIIMNHQWPVWFKSSMCCARERVRR